MDLLIEGLQEAISLLITFDPRVINIILTSLQVTGTALFFAALIGIPLGAFLGLSDFPGKSIIEAVLYTGMGFPPVAIGLLVFITFSSAGPFGFLNWLFTTRAMIIAQIIISFPLVAGFTMTAVNSVDSNLLLQLKALGATKRQVVLAILKESRLGVLVSVIAGFGAIISEVGAVMMVGGNIERSTRVLTTAIVLETRKGNFGLAISFGIILLTITFVVNFCMSILPGRGGRND
ncbi:ABC transporter permease [Natroniella acetigena]|uniref:ABC transporter permease n=1 Tax=Natroniella acetigena TaxID=52004 RepID=UPI002009F0F6|nr:ABC transporter permease [Natroniella acetigena]MCK8827167.1 ABC transporter permease [Natroniella acetigena]